MSHDYSTRTTCGLLSALATFAFLGSVSPAVAHEAPAFTFNDRCAPYQITDEFMRANGVEPTRISTTMNDVSGEEDGTGNDGDLAPVISDFDEFGNPVPCDEFHTNVRRTRYEGCHFYDGTPCFWTLNGSVDQNAFTDDEAGRKAFELAEHYKFYEVVQNHQCPGTSGSFADPFFGGFAVGTQVKIMDTVAGGAYFTENPLGLWKIGFLQFTEEAIANPNHPMLETLRVRNGVNAQTTCTGTTPMPLIFSGDEFFELIGAGLMTLRYRLGGDGGVGVAEGPRYFMCPVHQDPSKGDINTPGQDIIQGYPTHIEYQPPEIGMQIRPDVTDFSGRGHCRIPGSEPFGLTPPPGEQDIYNQFDCLQRTGDWCPGPPSDSPVVACSPQ